MPDDGTILYSTVSALFAILVAIVGFLIKRGLDNLQIEIRGLRSDVNKAYDKTRDVEAAYCAMKSACDERHKNIDGQVEVLFKKVDRLEEAT